MSAITYKDDFLAAGSNASQIDNDIRDWAQDIALGVGEFVFWPGSAASAGDSGLSTGEMLEGTAMLGNAAQPSSNLTQVLLGLQPTGSMAWHQRQPEPVNPGGFCVHSGSEGTMIVGGMKLETHDDAPVSAAPFTARWVVQTGSTPFVVTDSAATNVAITFATPYDAAPIVQTSMEGYLITGSAYGVSISPYNIIASGFSSRMSCIGAPTPLTDYIATLNWRSEGTVSY